MCGIVGFYDTKGKTFSNTEGVNCVSSAPELDHPLKSAVYKGMQMMKKRGPDGEGFFIGENVILGHKRLAVIDLKSGAQPLIDKRSGTAISFNGEIYNYLDLRKELIALGHTFYTESDTEVLLRSYLEWNTECLSRLNGMFAFSIYDPRNSQLILARDHLGIKPLFYSIKNNKLMFASSCSAIRCFPDIGNEIDLPAVSHYLSSIRTTLGERTLLKDVKTLLPGEYLVAKFGKDPVIKRYWDIPIIPEKDKETPSFENASNEILELLQDSVKKQLISDVPLGGFLSGGIDSSILSSLACSLTGNNFNAYSVGYDRKGYNEWDFVRQARDYYGMSCREIHLEEEEYPETWKSLINFKGLPISTPNEIAIFHLAKSLKEDFTVALSGEGADEIFGGYSIPYFSAFDYDRSRRSAPAPGEILSPSDRAIQKAYRRSYLLCRPDHYFLLNSWIPLNQKSSLLKRNVWDAIDQDSAMFDFYENWFEKLEDCSTFDAYMHIHARVNLEGLLSRVDSSTMAASVEARVPFTDHRIAEYAFSLPDHYKINWKNKEAEATGQELNIFEINKQNLIESKRLLRNAFKDNVPKEILERPKVSFPTPFREWFANGMNDLARTALEDSPLAAEIFSSQHITELLNTPEQPQSAMALWPIINLSIWQKETGATLP